MFQVVLICEVLAIFTPRAMLYVSGGIGMCSSGAVYIEGHVLCFRWC